MTGVFESFYLSAVTFLETLFPELILPNIQILLQIAILLVGGYLAGRIVKFFAVKVLSAVGLKRITSKTWAERMLKVAGYRGSIVELIADLVKWLVYILFLAIIIQTLGLPGVADIFTSVAIFIPRFIGAILIIAIGFLIADFFGKIFEEATRRYLEEEVLSSFAGGLVKYSVSLIAIIMSLALLGLDITTLIVMFSMILAAVVLVLLMGIKDVIPNYTAGVHVRRMFKPGEFVRIGKYAGVVEKFDILNVILKDGQRRISVPNSLILSSIVERKGK